MRVHTTVSADGYVAGPNQSLENPFGQGGGSLHDWAFALRAFREPHGMEGGDVNASNSVVEDELELEQFRTVEAPGVTHLKYRVLK